MYGSLVGAFNPFGWYSLQPKSHEYSFMLASIRSQKETKILPASFPLSSGFSYHQSLGRRSWSRSHQSYSSRFCAFHMCFSSEPKRQSEPSMSSPASAQRTSRLIWRRFNGCDVLLPTNQPRCIVHFIGGFAVCALPKVFYKDFLENLAKQDAMIIATPVSLGFNHADIAMEAYNLIQRALENLDKLDKFSSDLNALPLISMGHSQGCKIHLLMHSLLYSRRTCPTRRAISEPPLVTIVKDRQQQEPDQPPMEQNEQLIKKYISNPSSCNIRRTVKKPASYVLISFNNFPTVDSIPSFRILQQASRLISERLSGDGGVFGESTSTDDTLDGGETSPDLFALKWPDEFTPTPAEVLKLIQDQAASMPRCLVGQFRQDTLDQSTKLTALLRSVNGAGPVYHVRFFGSHVTPVSNNDNDGLKAWNTRDGKKQVELDALTRELCQFLNL